MQQPVPSITDTPEGKMIAADQLRQNVYDCEVEAKCGLYIQFNSEPGSLFWEAMRTGRVEAEYFDAVNGTRWALVVTPDPQGVLQACRAGSVDAHAWAWAVKGQYLVYNGWSLRGMRKADNVELTIIMA